MKKVATALLSVCLSLLTVKKVYARNKHADWLANQRAMKRRKQTMYKSYTSQRRSSSRKKSSGCYVATAVYGSYDCPPVWTLRRFRDSYLAERLWGKIFIKVYYTVSPCLVKIFGNSKIFTKVTRATLDKMVASLRKSGYSSEPYMD